MRGREIGGSVRYKAGARVWPSMASVWVLWPAFFFRSGNLCLLLCFLEPIDRDPLGNQLKL